tara:strand:+ start:2288 stop:2920 length:633 start_codon:yes stop_codon:yes gene_type:complete
MAKTQLLLDLKRPGLCSAKTAMRLIKRYANRRLYDAETSKTITLEDVAKCVQDGEEVRVVDNITGEDITTRVLGQTFLKVSTEQQNLEFATFLLSSLIREVSTNVTDFLSRLVQGGIGVANLTRERLEQIVQMMVEKGELQLSEKQDYLTSLMDQLARQQEKMRDTIEEGKGALRSEWEKDPDRPEKVPDMEELSARLDEMARWIRDMKK